MTVKEQLEDLLNPILEASNCFLIDIVLKPSKASQKVLILVDSDEGITIQECTSISRRLAKQLEEMEFFADAYTLEVSSPGLDHPLLLPRQFQKNIGRTLKVTLKTGEIVTGKLLEFSGNAIKIQLPEPKKKAKTVIDEASLLRELDLGDVSKAMVEISFK
ncbi:Ribosome maturation factor RimP [Dyadobacter sp. CECT 9275]|uniref:Ribosome maturation factor RimP n=1 Tax=Dyadobacter helix TaxID=2822344 RepID=A0A916N3J8_9BACT|nr:ribosome maturation factor RimP [Dyadobacter sp. CECT 9275]CAG4995239.1 Ribosome maturation factor RimP [Dyadobacter sp. CECT 9275]